MARQETKPLLAENDSDDDEEEEEKEIRSVRKGKEVQREEIEFDDDTELGVPLHRLDHTSQLGEGERLRSVGLSQRFVFAQEERYWLKRRKRMNPRQLIDADDEDNEKAQMLQLEQRPVVFFSRSLGVAFSGGGIRSACFCSGVLSKLCTHKLMKCVDYMSCVSGGGYTGAAYLTHVLDEQLPHHRRNLRGRENRADAEDTTKEGHEDEHKALKGDDKGTAKEPINTGEGVGVQAAGDLGAEADLKDPDNLLSEGLRSLKGQMRENVGYLVNGRMPGAIFDIGILILVIIATISAGPMMVVCMSFPVALFMDEVHGLFLQHLSYRVAMARYDVNITDPSIISRDVKDYEWEVHAGVVVGAWLLCIFTMVFARLLRLKESRNKPLRAVYWSFLMMAIILTVHLFILAAILAFQVIRARTCYFFHDPDADPEGIVKFRLQCLRCCVVEPGDNNYAFNIAVAVGLLAASVTTTFTLFTGSRPILGIFGALAFISSLVIVISFSEWRVFGSSLLPGPTCYNEATWKTLYCASVLVFVIGLVPYHKFRKTLHYYYRIRLRRAFYKGQRDIKLGQLTNKAFGRCLPYFISSVVMNDFKRLEAEGDHDPEAAETTHAGIKREAAPYALFSLAPKFCGSQRTRYMKTSLVPSLKLSRAMAISAAAIAHSMGTFENTIFRPLLSFLSAGLGDWLPFPPRFEKRFPEISIFLISFVLMISAGFLVPEKTHEQDTYFPAYNKTLEQCRASPDVTRERGYSGVMLICIAMLLIFGFVATGLFATCVRARVKDFKRGKAAMQQQQTGENTGCASCFRNAARSFVRRRIFEAPLYSPFVSALYQTFSYSIHSERTPPLVYLSDGGHLENLGLKQLLLRRCSHAVVVDAGEDPDYQFQDIIDVLDDNSVLNVGNTLPTLWDPEKKRWEHQQGNWREAIFALSPNRVVTSKAKLNERGVRKGRRLSKGLRLDAIGQKQEASGQREGRRYHATIAIEYRETGEIGYVHFIKVIGQPKKEVRGERRAAQGSSNAKLACCCLCCNGICRGRLFACSACPPCGEFPHTSTANQFFTTEHYEMYSNLGETAAEDLCVELESYWQSIGILTTNNAE